MGHLDDSFLFIIEVSMQKNWKKDFKARSQTRSKKVFYQTLEGKFTYELAVILASCT